MSGREASSCFVAASLLSKRKNRKKRRRLKHRQIRAREATVSCLHYWGLSKQREDDNGYLLTVLTNPHEVLRWIGNTELDVIPVSSVVRSSSSASPGAQLNPDPSSHIRIPSHRISKKYNGKRGAV